MRKYLQDNRKPKVLLQLELNFIYILNYGIVHYIPIAPKMKNSLNNLLSQKNLKKGKRNARTTDPFRIETCPQFPNGSAQRQQKHP